jgi:hypothetical protein
MPDMSDDLINFLLKAGSGGFNTGGGGGGTMSSALNTAKGGGNPAANFMGSGKNAISDGLTNAAANTIASGVDKASEAKTSLFGKLKNTLSNKFGGAAKNGLPEGVGDALKNGLPEGVGDALKNGLPGEVGDALKNGLPGGVGDALKNGLPGKVGDAMGMAGKLLGGGGGNNSGNPACGEQSGPPGELSSMMTSLDNKIGKTLETEIANNFPSIIESILKNPTAQEAMSLSITSALKPTLDNAIANTAYLNEIVKKEIEPKIQQHLLEFYEEYNTKSEKTKPEAFATFINKMKRIHEKVGDVSKAKESLDMLGGNTKYKSKHTTVKMGTVAKQLEQIIPESVDTKNKMSGGSRRKRRRTYKKRRFQPKK